ncbi:hypothetical protein COLO4_34194 [Corchorus olitorius]|uniref:Uncharacterized protein n=1 Tax=Corchorus olitorius TaxID=93759 RepID=A0A1R3GN08_9ROSI|nr:hypothetical protein COLO4_34194 [Corchorus olitorius]
MANSVTSMNRFNCNNVIVIDRPRLDGDSRQ